MQSKYRNAGQICVCTNRLCDHESLHDAFVEKLAQASKRLVIGLGLNKDVHLGPLIAQQAIHKVEQHVQDALAKGARLMTGDKRHALECSFYEPTILAGVKKGMLITEEETFGPVAAVIPFTSESEVIQMANDSEYGLAFYFYSKDISSIWRVAEALEFSMVGVNTSTISNEVAPFGSVKPIKSR